MTYTYNGNYTYDLKQYIKMMKSKRPIYKGCNNEACFCTGDCREILGYVNESDYQKFVEENIKPI